MMMPLEAASNVLINEQKFDLDRHFLYQQFGFVATTLFVSARTVFTKGVLQYLFERDAR